MLGAYLTLIDNDSDKKVFEALYTAYKNMMYNVAYGVMHDVQLSEDAVMNSFFVLARNMEQIADKTMSEMRNFLVVIVRNQAIDIYRKHQKTAYCEDELDELPDDSDTVYEVENKELQSKVFGAIKEIDKDCSDVLMMKYFYGFKTAEIAKSLGLTVNGVQKRITNGKKQIRKRLSEEGVI